MKAWPVIGIVAMQALLLAAHWFIYRTLMLYLPGLSGATVVALRMALVLLGFSFMAAAMLGFHHSGLAIRILYRVASIWLGFLNFFFGAACLCRLLGLALRFSPLAAELPVYRPVMASVLFSLAILISLYGLHNARRIRVRRMVIQLEGLPEVWRGRTILLISDLHLGNVNYLGYSRRMATLTASLDPEMVLIPGDLFDGSDTDPDRLLVPFRDLNPPLGIYFAMGNHDEFGGPAHYTAALARAGIHTLNSERVVVEGLQIVGIPYALSHDPLRLRIYLESLRLREGGASILLNHAPSRLPIVEEAGVSLQLSGHTHGGQLFPFTWIVRRAYGRFSYGLNRFGALQVYTSTGCGAWGPPMRVGSQPEVVLMTLEVGKSQGLRDQGPGTRQ